MGKYLNQNRMCVPHRQMYTRIQENRNLKKFEWSKHYKFDFFRHRNMVFGNFMHQKVKCRG